MKRFIDKIKTKMSAQDEDDEIENEYLELNTDVSFDKNQKVIVKPFTIEDFSDVKQILDSLREGYTIALVNIKPLKEKDMVELKRAVNKLKKTTSAIEGEIAAFGDDYIVIAPSFATIERSVPSAGSDDDFE
ncbi:hypothetical protein C0585_05740 [Candidatus Woesearchaeota archaeon]|nr:MAG: hypothetical protein C0585_05740 [Candidatus Woesearchaeota archaeon]